jgi:hypothetical protein
VISDDLYLAANPALATDGLAAFLRAHPGTEPDFASAFLLADLMGVMHV